MTVEYIAGHNPDLVLFDANGSVVDRIDLKGLDAVQLRALLVRHGLQEKRTDPCRDATTECGPWAASGECDRNPAYMHTDCAYSCGRCTAKAEL